MIDNHLFQVISHSNIIHFCLFQAILDSNDANFRQFLYNSHLFQAISDSTVIYFCLFQAILDSNDNNFRQF